ncbi:MAG TPA: ABC transporter permease subunit, partial [Acidimicrobiales bacterium]|nr:ABC transporter permease subunit [Acidimicrobiales bacterium]
MRGLLVGEVQRLLARRMLRVLALLGVAAIALAGVLTFLNTEDVDDAEMARRREAVRARVEACIDARQAVPPLAGEEDVSVEDRCSFGAASSLEDPRFRLRELTGVYQGTTAPLVVVGWLIGASSIGADWQSRTITTLLTWEPRRVRVILAKVLAAVLVASAFALLAQALVAGALAPSAALHGSTAGTGGTWLRTLFGVLGRGTLLVAVAAAVG